VLKVGEEVEARFTGVDRKNRVLSLSIKAKVAEEVQQAMLSYRTESNQTSSAATLGDLLKEQMKSD
jgi:small subunit ribosomal protein S1